MDDKLEHAIEHLPHWFTQGDLLEQVEENMRQADEAVGAAEQLKLHTGDDHRDPADQVTALYTKALWHEQRAANLLAIVNSKIQH